MATDPHHHIDPATVAADACFAAGLTFLGPDLQTFDPVRAALAERFVAEARRCRGDVAALTTAIRSQLAVALLAAEAAVNAEQAEGLTYGQG